MDSKEKNPRLLSLKIIAIEVLLFVATRPWFQPKLTDHISWVLCLLLAGYAAWYDHKRGLFDKFSVLYLLISLAISAVLLYLLLVSG